MKYHLRGMVLFFLICFATQVQAQTNVFFSPAGGCQNEVISEINKAQKTIDVAMYEFNSKEIAHALIQAKERKVMIKVSLDKAQLKEYLSKGRMLIHKGINVKFHMGPGLLHDKFAVIDDQVVLTGSYNWTPSAEKRNMENLLVITDKELARKYTKEFKIIWSHSGEGQYKENQPVELN